MNEQKEYDPDLVQKRADSITPEIFGILVARYMEEVKSSNAWSVARFAVEEYCDAEFRFGLEWDQIQGLIKRIAEADLPNESNNPKT